MKRNLLLVILLSFSLPLLAQYEQRHPSGKKAPERGHLLAPAAGARAKIVQNSIKQNAVQVNETYYYEGFEDWDANNPSALPTGWKQYRTQTLSGDPFANELADTVRLKWFMNNPDNYPYDDGSYTEYVYAGEGSMGVFWDAPGFTWAVTPTFTVGTSEKDIILSFYPWLANNFTNNWITKFHVRVYADGAWFQLYSYNAQNEDNNLFDKSINLLLNAFEGKNIRIAFIHQYNDGIQMAIDEITVAEELDNDFGLSVLEVFPAFGLLPGSEVGVAANVSGFGSIDGAVDVTLLVNGNPVDTITTEVLAQGGDSETIFFSWTPDEHGEFLIQLRLPNDDFADNNLLEEAVYVNHYLNLAEGFENFTTDTQGEVSVVWPPAGWTTNDADWIGPTTQWPIFEFVSAMLIGRNGASEKALITPAVTLSDQDEFISFYLEGVNNNVFVNQTGATPQGEQGFSTFRLKYSTSVTGPWTDLGGPVVFENLYDANDNLIQGANDRRYISHDITGLANGTYYFAFTSTSTFNLVIGAEDYYSFVMVDNVLVSQAAPVGIEELLAAKATTRIYPNPASNYITIESDVNIDRIEIYSILGRKVLTQALNETQIQLNIANLSKGIYIVVLHTPAGNKIHKLQISQ